MSVVDCGVFEDAYTALETEEYAGGDFALHYLPNIIALALVDPSTLVTDPESIKIQAWAALGNPPPLLLSLVRSACTHSLVLARQRCSCAGDSSTIHGRSTGATSPT